MLSEAILAKWTNLDPGCPTQEWCMMEKPTAGVAAIALNPTTAVRNNRYDRKSAYVSYRLCSDVVGLTWPQRTVVLVSSDSPRNTYIGMSAEVRLCLQLMDYLLTS